MSKRHSPWLVLLAAVSVRIAAKPLDPTALARSIGTSLPQDTVFYRWQSTISGQNLVAMKTLNKSADQRFMGMTKGITAGPGLYVANKPHSSATYMPPEGGNLIEARIPRETILVDLTDSAVMDKAKALGLDRKDLIAALREADGVLVQYTKAWLVAKNMAGRVHFNMYPGPEQSPEAVARSFDELDKGHAKTQFARQVKEHQPAIVDAVIKQSPFAPLSLEVISPDQFAAHVKKHLNRIGPGTNLTGLLAHLEARPADLRALAQDQPTFHRVASAMIDGPLEHPNQLKHASAGLLEALFDHGGLPAPARQSIAATLLDRHFRPHGGFGDLVSSAAKLSKWARATAQMPEMRSLISVSLTAMLQRGHPDTVQAAAMHDLIEAADLTKQQVGLSVGRAVEQRARIDHALRTKDASDIARALSGYTRMKDLAYDGPVSLSTGVGNAAWSAGIQKFLAESPNAFASLLKDDEDWAAALKPRFAKALGHDPFPRILDAAIANEDRQWFYHHCFAQPTCAENLTAEIERDGGKLLKTPADFRIWADNLTRLEWKLSDSPGLRKRLYAATYKLAQTPELLLAVSELYEHQDKMGQLFKSAEKIGLEKFTNDDLVQLGREASGSQQRRIFEAVLKNARSVEDVTRVSYNADYSRALEKQMRERLVALGVTEEAWHRTPLGPDWRLGERPSAAQSVAPKDCLGLMDRIRSAFRWRR